MPAHAPLVAVHHLSDEIAAGWGSASCRVRVLDGLSLELGAGQLVVIQASPGAGLSAVWAALDGRRVPARGWRVARPGLRVFRGVVPLAVVPCLVEAWRSTSVRGPSDTPAVWLLRTGAAGAATTTAWARWARQQRRAGHALVIGDRVPSPAVRRQPIPARVTHDGVVREAPGTTPPVVLHPPSARAARAPVWRARLVAGRLVTAP